MNDFTKYAPAERANDDEVKLDFEGLSQNNCSNYFDYFPLPLLILNRQRQVVFSNRAFIQMMSLEDESSLLGKRPGEVMLCAYSASEANGCGTAEHCRECGALHAVLESINTNSASTHDCQLLQSINGETHAKDLRIHSSPFEFQDTQYYVLTIMDVADEKNREMMERVFFHDILNSAGSAQSLVSIMLDEDQSSLQEPLELLKMALFGLVEEIKTHKELRLAEKGDYPFSPLTLNPIEIIELVAKEFRSHQVAEGKKITTHLPSENHTIKTDYSLLRRVLINMLKNALEATPFGGEVSMSCRQSDSKIYFEIHNDQVMDKSTQLQLFKRSFSTKGKGRGLGTYSVKLLTENYLSGEATFSSTKQQGTTFIVSLPISTTPE